VAVAAVVELVASAESLPVVGSGVRVGRALWRAGAHAVRGEWALAWADLQQVPLADWIGCLVLLLLLLLLGLALGRRPRAKRKQ
jgi:hypothetical protein